MNIRDIASISGYSVGTVSRVLNGHPSVSDRARARILEVVEEYGYEPNYNARFLKAQSMESVAVFVKGAGNRLFGEILELIQTQLIEAGEEAVVTYLDEDADEVAAAVRYQRIRHPKGILFLGGEPAYFKAQFAEIDVPSVLITNDATGLAFPNLSSVTTDDESAAYQMCEYLLSCGHRRIGIVGGNRSEGQVSGKRLRGATRALQEHGVSFDFDRDFEPCHFTEAEGYDAIANLVMRSRDLTAVFALGDVIAFGAVRAVYDMGLRIPDQLSLAGFDGVSLSQFAVPRITTIRQDVRTIARRGVEILLAAMAGEGGVVHEFVPYQLLKRESVCKL